MPDIDAGKPIPPKGLGRIPGEEDARDHPLRLAMARFGVPKTQGIQMWYSPYPRLDQGQEGACVGFSRTIEVNASPGIKGFDNAYAQRLYEMARRDFDEWDGEDYDGTSVRAGAQAAQHLELIKSYAFTNSVEEMALWLLNHRPIVIGIDWYEGMFHATKENKYYVKPTGQVAGGHAICITGVRWLKDGRDYFALTNSWGSSWGQRGQCRITVEDMRTLLSDPNAAACTAVEV